MFFVQAIICVCPEGVQFVVASFEQVVFFVDFLQGSHQFVETHLETLLVNAMTHLFEPLPKISSCLRLEKLASTFDRVLPFSDFTQLVFMRFETLQRFF